MYTRGLLNSDDIELPIFYLKKAAYNDNSDGIREYLSAMNNVPFEYITERYSKYSIYFVMERTRLIRKLRKAGINPLRDLAIISGIRLNPLSSFIQNDNYIEENEYDYEYEEIIDPKTKKKIKIPNRNRYSKDQINELLSIFQFVSYNYNDKTISEVEIKSFKSYQFDPNQYYICFSQFTIPKNIRDEIHKTITDIKRKIKYLFNYCYSKDPNDIFTIYYLPSYFHNFIQNKISTIMKNHKIQCYFPPTCESMPFDNYLYFNESLIPNETLTNLFKKLEMIQEIIEIKRNIFDGKQIVTVLIVKKGTEESIIQIIRDFLVKCKVSFAKQYHY